MHTHMHRAISHPTLCSKTSTCLRKDQDCVKVLLIVILLSKHFQFWIPRISSCVNGQTNIKNKKRGDGREKGEGGQSDKILRMYKQSQTHLDLVQSALDSMAITRHIGASREFLSHTVEPLHTGVVAVAVLLMLRNKLLILLHTLLVEKKLPFRITLLYIILATIDVHHHTLSQHH